MAIRNDNLGGTNWSDGEILYAADLNDTFDAVLFTDIYFVSNTGGYAASTAWGIMENASVSFTLSTTKSVMLEGFAPALHISPSGSSEPEGFMRLNINDTNYVGTTSARGWSGEAEKTSLITMYATTLAAGTYKVKLEWKKDTDTDYFQVDSGTRVMLTAKILPKSVTVHNL